MVVLLTIYIFYILYMTLLCRTPRTFYQYNYKLFWSYQYFFDQDHPQGRQIILNILFFVPFGFLLSAVLNSFQIKSKKRIFLITIIAACLLYSAIEFLKHIAIIVSFEARVVRKVSYFLPVNKDDENNIHSMEI